MLFTVWVIQVVLFIYLFINFFGSFWSSPIFIAVWQPEWWEWMRSLEGSVPSQYCTQWPLFSPFAVLSIICFLHHESALILTKLIWWKYPLLFLLLFWKYRVILSFLLDGCNDCGLVTLFLPFVCYHLPFFCTLLSLHVQCQELMSYYPVLQTNTTTPSHRNNRIVLLWWGGELIKRVMSEFATLDH